MPKLGMEPIRRAALVKATIDEIGAVGNLDVTVSNFAKRAGMFSVMAHHYFGGKQRAVGGGGLGAGNHVLTLGFVGDWGVCNAYTCRTQCVHTRCAVWVG